MDKGGLKAVGWGEKKEVEEKARKKKSAVVAGTQPRLIYLDLWFCFPKLVVCADFISLVSEYDLVAKEKDNGLLLRGGWRLKYYTR